MSLLGTVDKLKPLRIMYKLTGVTAIPAVLGLVPGAVYAATKDKPNTMLNTDELSLYTVPQQKLRYVEPEVGHLEQGVSILRKMAEPYAFWCQNKAHTAVENVECAFGTVKLKVESVIRFGNESYDYLRNPPTEFYPRAGVIGFAGILGLFLARGSRVKKAVYPISLMAVGTSLYYPQRAATITKAMGDSLYDWALKSYLAMESVVKPSNKPVAQKSEEK